MTLYLLSLIVGLIFAVIVIYIPLRKYGTIAIGLTPAIWFSVFFIIIHIVMPALKHTTNTYRYQTGYPLEEIVPYVWCLIFSYLIVAIILNYAAKRTLRRAHRTLQFNVLNSSCRYKDRMDRLLILGTVMLIIGAFTAYKNYGQLGEDYLSDRISAGVGRGLEVLLPNLLLSAAAVFLYITLKHTRLLQKQSLKAFMLFIISFVFAFAYYSSTSSRNSIFILIILSITLYGLMRPVTLRLSASFLRRFLLTVAVLWIAFIGFTEITKERYSGGGSYAEARQERLVFFMFDGAFGNDENILWLSSNSFDYQFGASYVAAFTNFIPRSIWADKPLGAGPRIRNAIYPGSYVVGREGNSSITTGLFTEAYLNFGSTGFFLVPIIWAFIAIGFANKVARNLGSVMMLPWAVGFILWSTAIMYSEFLGFFSRFVFITLPLFMAAILCTHRLPSENLFLNRDSNQLPSARRI